MRRSRQRDATAFRSTPTPDSRQPDFCSPAGNRGLSWRGLGLGVILCLLLAYAEPYVKLRLHTNGLCTDYITAGALLFFFILLVILWPLRVATRTGLLSTSDLVTIYVMLTVACAIPSHGLLAPLFPVITGVYYYATAENQWADLIHAHLPKWMVIHDESAARLFFEGAGEGAEGAVPWAVWLTPLLAWAVLILAAYWVMLCLAVIFRRQWTEVERLTFPLVRLPLEMVQTDEKGRRPFFRSRAMWIGFAVAFILMGSHGLRYYYPDVPVPRLHWYLRVLSGRITFQFFISFIIIGFSYLLPLDVALSLWFFHILIKYQAALMEMNGITLTGGRELWGGSSLATTHQNAGAIIMLVLFGLWLSRQHLWRVLRQAFTDTSEPADPGELLTYRQAAWGGLVGLAIIGGWLYHAGVPLVMVPFVLFAVFVTFLGLTRVVVQAGVGFLCAGISPPTMVTSCFGSGAFGARGIVALGSLYTWAFEGRTLVLASVANGFKLCDETRTRKRVLLVPIILAVLITLVVSGSTILHLAYEHGGSNLRRNWFYNMPHSAWRAIAEKVRHPVTSEMVGDRWWFTGFGAAFMLFLMYMRTRFYQWPFHFIGFPVADIWMMNLIWFNVFVAWLIKRNVLRYGGAGTYRRTVPFFLGAILGQLSVAGLWMLIDSITGEVGHFVPVGLG